MQRFLLLVCLASVALACDNTSSSRTWTVLLDTGPNSPSGPTGLDLSSPIPAGTYYLYGVANGCTNCDCSISPCNTLTQCCGCRGADNGVWELSTGPLTGTPNQAEGPAFDDPVPLKDHSGIVITLAPGTYNMAMAARNNGFGGGSFGSFGPSVTFTVTAAGGGGDPHIFSASLPKYLELSHFVRSLTGRSDAFNVTLISSETDRLVGELGTKPGTDKSYLTAFSLASGDEMLRVSFEIIDGQAYAMIDNHVRHSCHDATASEFVAETDSYTVRMDCGDVVERAAANPVIEAHFQNHIPFARAIVNLETPDFDAELVFVQKEQHPLDFGFFDFFVQPHTAGNELGGIFGFNGLTGAARNGEPVDQAAANAVLANVMF